MLFDSTGPESYVRDEVCYTLDEDFMMREALLKILSNQDLSKDGATVQALISDLQRIIGYLEKWAQERPLSFLQDRRVHI